ncbi:MAG: hypothetical protein Q8S84_07120 [bacterium]|nr:hypothetical protein [bacterium]MDP3381227.1 hypothetical protein [bacterium]
MYSLNVLAFIFQIGSSNVGSKYLSHIFIQACHASKKLSISITFHLTISTSDIPAKLSIYKASLAYQVHIQSLFLYVYIPENISLLFILNVLEYVVFVKI